MAKEDLLKTIGSLKDRAMNDYKAEIKGIFGSYVRGEETDESDVDVLVEFQHGADLFDFVGLSQFLEEHLSCKVDVVVLSSLREELKPHVLREVVYL